MDTGAEASRIGENKFHQLQIALEKIMNQYVSSSLDSATLDSTLQIEESAGKIATLVNEADI